LAETLLVSSLVLIPVAPSGLELTATRRLLRQINRARRKRGDAGPEVLVVPSRLSGPCEDMEAVLARLALLGQELAPPLALRPEYEAAFARGLWVGAASPGSSAHEEISAVARLVRERLSHLSPCAVADRGWDCSLAGRRLWTSSRRYGRSNNRVGF
jgi:chromosome partitioning protein